MNDFLLPLVIGLMIFAALMSFIPVIPAAALTWAVGMVYGALERFTRLTPLAAVIITVIMVIAVTAGLWLPMFGMRGKGMSCWGLLAFFVGSISGTFLIPIPVLGSIIGGIAAVVLAEWARIGEINAALRSGGAAVRVIILGFVLEFAFSVTILITFVISVISMG